jgi:hypothetical protein
MIPCLHVYLRQRPLPHLLLGFEKMARGSLQSYFQDRTNPLDKRISLSLFFLVFK